LQRSLHDRVARGEAPETWIAVEHDPVVTLGRNANPLHVRVSREMLAAGGVDCVEIERGGDATYHGPGQLVVYPIRRLERFREVVPLVRALERAVIGACAQMGVDAVRWEKHAGVWVGSSCLCAVGLAIQQMTSLHGIALNVSIDLSYDRLITPCGLPDRGITSLSRECGRHVGISEAKAAIFAHIERVFDFTFVSSVFESRAVAKAS